jgi:hypothetical protein
MILRGKCTKSEGISILSDENEKGVEYFGENVVQMLIKEGKIRDHHRG